MIDVEELAGILVDQAIVYLEDLGEQLLPVEQDELYDNLMEIMGRFFPPHIYMHEDEDE